jgi:hypothetical protein
MAELLDSLELGGVAGYQFQTMLQGNGSDHGVGKADRVAGAFKLTRDAAGQFGSGMLKGENFLEGDSSKEGLQAGCGLVFWKPLTISMTVTADTVRMP